MATERYLSDNPFRLLNVGSDTRYSELRRKADSVAFAAKVGMVPDVPLAAFFGESLEEVQSRVRALAADPVERTVLRIFWPAEAGAVNALVDESGVTESSSYPFLSMQTEFLLSWSRFVRGEGEGDLARVMTLSFQLLDSEPFNRFLLEALTEDDGISERDATSVATDAKNRVLLHLGYRAASVAEQAWSGGDRTKAKALIVCLSTVAYSVDLRQKAFEPIAALAGRLGDRLRDASDDLSFDELVGQDEKGIFAIYDSACDELEELAKACGFGFPGSRFWLGEVQEYCDFIARQIRDLAIEEWNEQMDGSSARALLKLALSMDPSKGLAEQIKEERDRLKILMTELKSQEAASQHWADVKPVKSAPSNVTISGAGVMVYGVGKFRPEPRLRYAIQYFTLAFLPIFPLRRFVAERDGNGWRFYGQTGWTPGMAMHFALSFLALTWMFMALGDRPHTDPWPQPEPEAISTPVQVSTIPPTLPNYGGAEHVEDSGFEQRQKHLDRLEEEAKSLEVTLRAKADEIPTDRDALQRDKKALDLLENRLRNDKDSVTPDKMAAYNARVDDYRLRTEGYNKLVDLFNKKVKDAKRGADRLRSIEQELREAGR